MLIRYFVRDHSVMHDVTTCEAIYALSTRSRYASATRGRHKPARPRVHAHDMRLRTNPYTSSNTIAPITDAIQPAACPG